MPEAKKDVAVTAGRGVLFITGAKLWFIVAGYAITFVLPRLLDEAAFGAYSQVVAAVSILNNVLITGTIQAVSRFSAEDDARAPAVLRTALGIQVLIGLGLAGAWFGAAPFVASRFLHKPGLVPYLWLSAGVVLAYAVYAALVGSLNGRKLFHRQATLDVTFSTLRAGLTLGLAAAGFGALGAIAGFASASLGVLVVALAWVGIGRSGEGVSARRYLAFVAPLFAYHLPLNGVLQFDILLLSRAVSIAAVGAGQTVAAAADAGNVVSGYYRATQQVAFIPYQLVLSVAFVVFPLVSRATFEKDEEATRGYIRGALRFALLLTAGVAAVFAARPTGVLGILFPPAYARAGAALSILAGGVVAFSLFTIACTILNGAGRARTTALLAAVAFGAVVGCNLLLVPGRSGAAAMTATAIATSAGMLLALLLSAGLLVKVFGAFVPIATLLRTTFAAAVVVGAGRLLPSLGKLVELALLAALVVLYAIVLGATRELGADDLSKLRRIVRGK